MTFEEEKQFRDECRVREQAATPGPWVFDPPREDDKWTWVTWGGSGFPIAGTSGRILIPDALFIANARTDIPKLLALLDQKDETIRQLRRFESAVNLMLTAVNPSIRVVAQRYLDGVDNYEEFLAFLRKYPAPKEEQSA